MVGGGIFQVEKLQKELWKRKGFALKCRRRVGDEDSRPRLQVE